MRNIEIFYREMHKTSVMFRMFKTAESLILTVLKCGAAAALSIKTGLYRLRRLV